MEPGSSERSMTSHMRGVLSRVYITVIMEPRDQGWASGSLRGPLGVPDLLRGVEAWLEDCRVKKGGVKYHVMKP